MAMPKTPPRDYYDDDLPPTPPSSVFKRRYYDDKGEPTESWNDHIPDSLLGQKNVKLKAEKISASPKKVSASPGRKKPSGFDYRLFPRPSKAAERVRQSNRQRRKDVPWRPMPQSLSSTPCVPGRGFIAPERISPRYYVVIGAKRDEITGKKMYQAREAGRIFWVDAKQVMKQSVKEYLRREAQFK